MRTSPNGHLLAIGLTFGAAAVAADSPECHHDIEIPALAAMNQPLIGGGFKLIDAKTGKSVSEDTYNGRVRVVFFGFTNCTTICPVGLFNLSQTLNHLGDERDQVQALFITTDPERDSPEVITAYVSNFADDIVGLTGTDQQLAQANRAFRTEAVKVQIQSEDVYQMDHPGIFYLMDRHGHFIQTMDSAGDPKKLAVQVRTALASTPLPQP